MTLDPTRTPSCHALRVAMDMLPLGVVIVNSELVPTYANPAGWEHLSSWIGGQLRAPTISEVSELPNEVSQAFHALAARRSPSGQSNSAAVVAMVHPSDPTLCCTVAVAPGCTERDAHRLLMLERVSDREARRLRRTAMALLSEAERNVVYALVAGRSNQAIAATLHLSEHTVKSHLQRIFGKLQVSSRAELLALVLG